MVNKAVWFLLLLVLGIPQGAPAQESSCLVLKGGNLVVSPGKVLVGATLVARDGIIVEIGKKVHIPWDAKVLDCRGLWIYPGFVHIAARTGLRGPGNPNLKPAKVLDPDPSLWKPFLKAGFTTVGVMGRGRGMTGEVAVLRPAGKTREEMVRIECAAAAFGAGGDGATARSVAKILEAGKKELERRKKEAQAKAKAKAAAEAAKKKAASKPASRPSKPEKKKAQEKPAPRKPSPKPKTGPAPKPAKTAKAPSKASRKPAPRKVPSMILLAADVMEGKIPAFVEVSGPTGFLYFQKALGALRPPLLLFADRPSRGEPPLSILASKVKALGASVVVPTGLASLPFDQALDNPALDFARAGVEFILQPGEGRDLAGFRLRLVRLAKYGLNPDDVLAAITTRTARWLGLAGRIGTLEKGKNADLLIFSGKFLDLKARLLRVVLEGETVYEFKK
ncbi:MAG TPA: hypothetical protein ENJ97_05375 [Planctomycetes bacterium]|nr:hypothetical protein [Planctomycetota bacterium]